MAHPHECVCFESVTQISIAGCARTVGVYLQLLAHSGELTVDIDTKHVLKHIGSIISERSELRFNQLL